MVHGFLSSQSSGAAPGVHVPPAHWSPTLHVLPSSQAKVLAACPQPDFASQLSVVHSWPSSHEMPTPLHVPLAQTSPEVHASPSSQLAVLNVCRQPWSALHASLVHASWSSQS